MTESYTTGGDTLFQVDTPFRQGQTFRVREDHILEFIDLNMRGGMTANQPVITVFMADSNHEPFGDYLSRDRAIVERLSTPFKTGRVRFSMQPYLLTTSFYYVIIVTNYPPFLGNPAWWQYDTFNATYLRGLRISSSDAGATWTKHYNDDCIFAESGYPPAPPSPAPPPLSHFAILDASFSHWDPGLIIRLPTNIPCHLTCYYTDKTPLKHHRSRTIRGLKVPWGTYFCFVAWKSVEQTEPGDTLYHTFYFSEWPSCTHFPGPWNMSLGLQPPYWEPWGHTLSANHPWLLIPEHSPPVYDLTDGLLTLESTDYESKGIRYYPPTPFLPFHNVQGAPLCFNAYHTHTAGNPATNRTSIMLYTINHLDSYHINLTISRGDHWATFGENKDSFPTRGIMDYGQGPTPLNLVNLWTELREMQGLPSDPTGWQLAYVRVELLQEPEGGTTVLTSDYINLFYPTHQIITPSGNERYFTFRGKVDLQDLPSVGPIFKHCHPGGLPLDQIQNSKYDAYVAVGPYNKRIGTRLNSLLSHINSVTFRLWRSPTATGPVTATLRLVSDDSIIATAFDTLEASQITPGWPDWYTFNFLDTHITNFDIRLCLEYTGPSIYFCFSLTDEIPGYYTYYRTSWRDVPAYDPNIILN